MISKEALVRFGRRLVVMVATFAVIGAAVGTVQVAAQWRAEAAPLDTAPASMTSVSDEYVIETERADDIATQMSGVARQISSLQAAVITADGSVTGDTESAASLQAQLDAAALKLVRTQKQLKAAQARLAALNRAAARQAALNRAASSSRSNGSSTPAKTPAPREHEDDDD